MTTESTIDTGTSELLCVIRDRVAVITLNRPEARNSLSALALARPGLEWCQAEAEGRSA